MLTDTQSDPLAAEAEVTGYLCMWTGVDTSSGAVHPLGYEIALTPRLALRWAVGRAHWMAPQLQPPAMWIMDGWCHDLQEHDRLLIQLRAGIDYRLQIPEETARFELLISPASGGTPSW